MTEGIVAYLSTGVEFSNVGFEALIRALGTENPQMFESRTRSAQTTTTSREIEK